MDLGKYIESRYLASADLKGPVVGTIKGFTEEEVGVGEGDEKKLKPVIFFEEAKKGMVLNVTNIRRLAKIFGPEIISNPEKFIGRKVEIYVAEVNFKGEEVPALRLRETALELPKPEERKEMTWGG